jgi:hypothetical protein
MDVLMVLKIIAALVTTVTGLLAFLKPSAVYGFTGLKADGARGVSEIRSVFGGLFIGLGIAPFFLGATAYTMLGIAYLTIAVARVLSIVIDRSYAKSNWISLGIEIVLGVILVI